MLVSERKFITNVNNVILIITMPYRAVIYHAIPGRAVSCHVLLYIHVVFFFECDLTDRINKLTVFVLLSLAVSAFCVRVRACVYVRARVCSRVHMCMCDRQTCKEIGRQPGRQAGIEPAYIFLL